MGMGRWKTNDWGTYKTKNVSGKSRTEVFKSRTMRDEYNPKEIQVRESRDSDINPNSTPIIIASDVTGSMGMIAHELMNEGINTVAKEIYERKPIPDPHIMVMAIGDAECDTAPLQVTQFEADIRLADQVRELYIEGGGGGNRGESYNLAHVFAATKVASDAWEKRKKKGYLFTIGDEPVLNGCTKAGLERFIGGHFPSSLSAQECVDMARRTFEVFHIVLTNEGFAAYSLDEVLKTWNPILPQRVIKLADVSKLGETIVSTIQVMEGEAKNEVAASWGTGTDLIIADAIRDLTAQASTGGVVRL